MKILVDLINYPKAGGASYDWRFAIIIGLCRELERRGHTFEACYHRMKERPFPTYTAGVFDYYIALSPYGFQSRRDRYNKYRKAGKPVTCYDHGWLPKSLVVDQKRLFGDSYYYHTIRDRIQECPSPEAAEPIRQKLLKGNLSKRTQTRKDKIPNVRYIFIPGQVLYDASIVNYSKTGLKGLMTQTIRFAKQHGLHVVYKPHPGLDGSDQCSAQTLKALQDRMEEKHENFHIVNTSIYDLMERAEFTACVNSGSIIDNIVSQTPVYCCGKSFFAKSGTVIYDPNVEQGLTTMLNKDYDNESMKKQQLRMLWWLDKYMVQEHQPIEKQIELWTMHSGVTL